MPLRTVIATTSFARSIHWVRDIMLLCMTAMLMVNCRKDGHSCSGVQCQNGGVCSEGICKCLVTYTGAYCETLATTHIMYMNHAHTPVTVALKEDSIVIPAGESKTFSGQYTTYLSTVAITSGTKVGKQLGELITWALDTPYPKSDTAIVDLDVPATYFFLNVKDKHPYYSIKTVEVYHYGYDRLDSIAIPNDGAVHAVGYYSYVYTNYVSTLVEVASSSSIYWDVTLHAPAVINQSDTVVIQ